MSTNKSQSQASLLDQLRELVGAANKEGLYDAADWLKDQLATMESPKERTDRLRKEAYRRFRRFEEIDPGQTLCVILGREPNPTERSSFVQGPNFPVRLRYIESSYDLPTANILDELLRGHIATLYPYEEG